MDHVAIMKKEWGLIPKILNGTKTVESRWYKSKSAPWNKIKKGDTVYFKDSGKPVTVRATVTGVQQYVTVSNSQALKIMKEHAVADLGTGKIPDSVKNYITNKKYAVFVFFSDVEKIPAFDIDKSGFGMQCAWLCVKNVQNIQLRINITKE